MNKKALVFFLLSGISSASGQEWLWEGKPTVYIVGNGSCAKAICAGQATMEVVGYSDVVIEHASPFCGAKGDSKTGYKCPDAQDCVDEETPGVSIGKFTGVLPAITPTEDEESEFSSKSTPAK